MTAPGFEDIGACVFDAYGTLFDFNSRSIAAATGRRPRRRAVGALAQKQLQYTCFAA